MIDPNHGIWNTPKAFRTTGTADVTSKQVIIIAQGVQFLRPRTCDHDGCFFLSRWLTKILGVIVVSWPCFFSFLKRTYTHKENKQTISATFVWISSHFSLLLAWCLCHDWWEWVRWNHQMQCRMPVCCRSLLLYGKAWWRQSTPTSSS